MSLFTLLAQQAASPPASQPIESVIGKLHIGRTFTETKWLGWGWLLLCIFAGVAAGKLMQQSLRGIARAWMQRGWKLRGTVVLSAAGPSNLALMTLGLSAGLTAIVIVDPLDTLVAKVVEFLFILSFAWFAYNLVDLIDVALRHLTAKTESKLDDQIVPLIRKTLRIFLVVVFILSVAENVFGADITAWLAGLGIAGLAVSLAAQDSIKNLFGSITIFLDRPFAVGDRIVFDGHDGPVEEIGFRSTKIRTLLGELVTIPNSKIVDGSVNNIGRRPHIRRLLNVTITYDTPPEKVEQAVQIVRDIFADPEIAPAFADMTHFPPRAYFSEFNADSLNIQVLYWFYPPDYWQYLAHAQKFNMKLLRAYAEAGIEFAFPTQTIYLAGDGASASAAATTTAALARDKSDPNASTTAR